MTRTPADRDRWKRIEAILDEALELPTEDREAYLESACDGDEQLLREVRALVDADEKSGGFLETSAQDFAATLFDEIRAESAVRSAAELEGQRLGPYQVERLAGGGGMGVV